MMRRVLALVGLSVAAALSLAGLASEASDALPTAPFLRIETGTHIAPIKDLALDPGGGVVATTSDDKTVRLWSTDDGSLLKIIRPPMDLKEEGVINSVEYWPGGNFLFMSGITGAAYLESSASGPQNYLYLARRDKDFEALLKRAPGGIIRKIAVFEGADKADHRVALAHTSNPHGVQVLSARMKVLFRQDFGQAANWVEFARDGRLLAATAGGEIHLFSADFQSHRVWRAENGQPTTARFSADGRTIAVGYAGRAGVDLLRAADLSHIVRLAPPGSDTASFGALAWDSDGGLWAGGNLFDAAGKRTAIRRWQNPLRSERYSDLPVAGDAITALERAPDGHLYFGTADPAFGKIDPWRQAIVFVREAPKADYRSAVARGLFANSDATIVTFATGEGERAMQFDAQALTLQPSPTRRIPRGEPLPRGLADWEGRSEPKLNGRQLALYADELARSAAALPNGGVAIGADFSLRLYDRQAGRIAVRQVASAVFGLAVSGDGSRLVAAHGDGTLRWYDLTSPQPLEEVAALFIDRSSNNWILWSPDGYFTHSDTGGQDLAGFSVNRGRGQTARWIEFSQLYRERHRRQLMQVRVGRMTLAEPPLVPVVERPVEEVIQEAPDVTITQFCAVDALDQVGECWPASQATRAVRRRKSAGEPVSQALELPAGVDRIQVHFAVSVPEEEIKSIDVFINGKTTGQTTRSIRRRPKQAEESASADAAVRSTGVRTVSLFHGQNTLYVRAYRHEGVFGKSQSLVLTVPAPPQQQRPELHVLAIGVNQYEGEGIPRLSFAKPDAISISNQFMNASATGPYANTHVITLRDQEVTREAITRALDEIAGRSSNEDAVIIYIAGHGVIDDGTGLYYFIQSDVPAWDRIASTAISQEEIVAMIGNVPAKNILLMLDTCHSGAFPAEAANNIGNETGYYVLAASSDTQEALDGYNAYNGVFATAVLRGLDGGAAYRGVVEALDLGRFVQREVPKLASEKRFRQTAQFRSSGGNVTEFPIVVVGE